MRGILPQQCFRAVGVLCIGLLVYTLLCTLPGGGRNHAAHGGGHGHHPTAFGCVVQLLDADSSPHLSAPVAIAVLPVVEPEPGILRPVNPAFAFTRKAFLFLWQTPTLFAQRVLLLT